MAKNEQSREVSQPVWFDGKSINEALFCDDFLSRHKIIYTNGAFFTPDGRVTDELPLRGEIFEELKCCAVSVQAPADTVHQFGAADPGEKQGAQNCEGREKVPARMAGVQAQRTGR